MATDPKLETYLAALDKALAQISISDRADIVTEIKAHVIDAQQRDPSQNIGSILASLGEPQNVANRYLIERGLKPGRPGRGQVVKWLMIGFLGTIGFIILSIGLLIWKLTPLISVDDTNDRVKILGGLIDITDKDGKFSKGTKFHFDIDDGKKLQGKFQSKGGPSPTFDIRFSNGEINVKAGEGNEANWECQVKDDEDRATFGPNDKGYKVDLGYVGGAKCDFEIPAKMKVLVLGDNAKLELDEVVSEVQAEIGNGYVVIHPDNEKTYSYDVHVKNGHSDEFAPSKEKGAIPVKIKVTNGYIKKS